jgi:hypothetical protein
MKFLWFEAFFPCGFGIDDILPLKTQDKEPRLSTTAYLGPRDWQLLHHSVNRSVILAYLTMATLIQNILLVFRPRRNAETAHRPTTRILEDPMVPIYFFDSDKPYFELAKLS